jgi:hypothetical protein
MLPESFIEVSIAIVAPYEAGDNFCAAATLCQAELHETESADIDAEI